MRGGYPSDTSHCLPLLLLEPCCNLKYGSVAIVEASNNDVCGGVRWVFYSQIVKPNQMSLYACALE